jgi:hypothetical protein
MTCPYCDREIQPPGAQGGRPRRWCSAGCQRAGEAEMRRTNQVLRQLEKDRARQQVHFFHAPTMARLEAQIAEHQARFNYLAGVPEGRLMTEDEC